MIDNKRWVKNDGNFRVFEEKKIHKVDSPFNEALISGVGRPENLGKMSNSRDIYYYANREVVNFETEY